MATKPTRPEPPAPLRADPRHPPKGDHDDDDRPDGGASEPVIIELRVIVPVPKTG
jgi:hypothetical protein